MDPETAVNTGFLLQMLTLQLPFSAFRPDYRLHHAKKWHPAVTKHGPKHTEMYAHWACENMGGIKALFHKIL